MRRQSLINPGTSREQKSTVPRAHIIVNALLPITTQSERKGNALDNIRGSEAAACLQGDSASTRDPIDRKTRIVTASARGSNCRASCARV